MGVVICAMQAKLTLILALGLAFAPAVFGQRMELSQVPTAVRTGIESARDMGAPKSIVRHTQGDRTFYEVEFERNNAPNPRVRFAEDGTMLSHLPAMSGMEEGWMLAPAYTDGPNAFLRSTLKLTDLPEAVQATARREAEGREIADIDQERWDGRTVYEIEFGQRGRNSQIHVAEDGTVVRDERAGRSLKSIFLGTQVQDTPPAVQETIRRLTGDREIMDIDVRGTRERPVYRVTARRNGVSYEVLHIAGDGKVLSGGLGGVAPDRG